VAARRTQSDAQLWQVPALSLTAQAFLFTIALAPESRPIARIISCSLSIVSALLAIELMTRWRQAEIADAEWLESYDHTHFAPSARMHGQSWRDRRNATDADAGLFSPLRRLPAFLSWSIGLLLFAVAAVVILVLTLLEPGLLEHS